MSLNDVARKIIFNPEIRSLLLDAKAGKPLNPSSPFTKLVQYQLNNGGNFQIGEPFTGDIVNADILVVSSNPAYNPLEDAPIYDPAADEVIMPNYQFTPNWTPGKRIHADNVGEILDTFHKIRMNLNAIPLVNGKRKFAPVRYWTNIKNLVAWLFPGKSFALTEVVQYRSNREYGVQEALSTCWEYAKEIIACSGAKVIIITAKASALEMFTNNGLLGTLLLHEHSNYEDTEINLYTQNIGGIDRLIFNARYRQSVAYKHYFLDGSQILKQIREALK